MTLGYVIGEIKKYRQKKMKIFGHGPPPSPCASKITKDCPTDSANVAMESYRMKRFRAWYLKEGNMSSAQLNQNTGLMLTN